MDDIVVVFPAGGMVVVVVVMVMEYQTQVIGVLITLTKDATKNPNNCSNRGQ